MYTQKNLGGEIDLPPNIEGCHKFMGAVNICDSFLIDLKILIDFRAENFWFWYDNRLNVLEHFRIMIIQCFVTWKLAWLLLQFDPIQFLISICNSYWVWYGFTSRLKFDASVNSCKIPLSRHLFFAIAQYHVHVYIRSNFFLAKAIILSLTLPESPLFNSKAFTIG